MLEQSESTCMRGQQYSQLWHRKTIRPGIDGDIVFFRELEDKTRDSNILSAGQIPVREAFLMKKLVLRFKSTDSYEDICRLMDHAIIRIHIEGDDAYRFVRPTETRFGFEFHYECGTIPLGAGQSFNVSMHFSSTTKNKEPLTLTMIIEGLSNKVIFEGCPPPLKEVPESMR